MCPTRIDLYDIAHVKVKFFRLQKIYIMLRLGRFVWTTTFEQCAQKKDQNLPPPEFSKPTFHPNGVPIESPWVPECDLNPIGRDDIFPMLKREISF